MSGAQDFGKIPHHGHYNVDPAEYDRVKSKSWIYRGLKQFPPSSRVAVGTFTVIAVSLAVYALIMPKTTKPLRTMTPEWQKATQEYANKQQAGITKRQVQEEDSE